MYLGQINSSHERYVHAQKQVMTGKKFEYASESPGDAQFVITASDLKARVEQHDANLRGANDYLKHTEAAFSELNSIMNSAYTIAVNGANSTYDQAARDGMANQIIEIQKRLTQLANSKGANDQYIFAGQKTSVKPFTQTPPTLTYSGDDFPVNVEIRPGETMRVNLNDPGNTFSKMYDSLETLKNDLMSGDLSRLGNQDITDLQAHLKTINSVRGDVGTKLQTVSNLKDQNQKRIDTLATQIADAQEIDMSQAITNMQLAENAYTAAMQVTSRAQSLSLMDYLK